MHTIAVATEDVLSESVAIRLLQEGAPETMSPLPLRKGGFGYLKTNIAKFYELAKRHPVFLLTDLDSGSCPVELISNWCGTRPRPPSLIFRVAVRETESWLLADRDAMSDYLGISVSKFPVNPDELPDPKRTLLSLAERSPRRDIKRELVRARGAIAAQGLGYNQSLTAFVGNLWSPERAAKRSKSLWRARLRLAEALG